MDSYQVNSIIKDGNRTFRVLKVNKLTVRVREIFISKKGRTITEKMGEFFEIKVAPKEAKPLDTLKS